MVLREGLAYDDVLLVPRKSSLSKREHADVSSYLLPKFKIDVPIVSSPMSSVTEERMATAMRTNGGFGVIHRFMPIHVQVDQFRQVNVVVSNTRQAWRNAACAIGLKDWYDRIDALYNKAKFPCRIFVLDVAHAHHDTVGYVIEDIIKIYRDEIYLIAGNIATPDGARFLVDLGVQGVKVGIGSGAACTTRVVTGFGVPQLSAIMSVYAEINGEATIIADGGIKNSGDIVKALAAGADTVMLGRLLAGCDEAPHPGEYFGMASKRVNGHHAPEGVEGQIESIGPLKDVLKNLRWGLRSGLSYGGAANIADLRENAEFIRVTPLASLETGVRI
jgi:IMP dehydrogenase